EVRTGQRLQDADGFGTCRCRACDGEIAIRSNHHEQRIDYRPRKQGQQDDGDHASHEAAGCCRWISPRCAPIRRTSIHSVLSDTPGPSTETPPPDLSTTPPAILESRRYAAHPGISRRTTGSRSARAERAPGPRCKNSEWKPDGIAHRSRSRRPAETAFESPPPDCTKKGSARTCGTRNAHKQATQPSWRRAQHWLRKGVRAAAGSSLIRCREAARGMPTEADGETHPAPAASDQARAPARNHNPEDSS